MLLHEQLCGLLGQLTSAANKPRREILFFPFFFFFESHHERLALLPLWCHYCTERQNILPLPQILGNTC